MGRHPRPNNHLSQGLKETEICSSSKKRPLHRPDTFESHFELPCQAHSKVRSLGEAEEDSWRAQTFHTYASLLAMSSLTIRILQREDEYPERRCLYELRVHLKG